MKKMFTFWPWLATVGVAWSLGFFYNVYYGGELKWLLQMYEQKVSFAKQIDAPRRIIFAGGSGVQYSINSQFLEQELKIPVFNFGLQGDLGLNVICPIILEQVRPGDIVVLSPEYLMLLDDDGIGYGDGLFGSVPFSVAIGKPGLGNIPLEQLVSETWLMGVPSLRAMVKTAVDVIQTGKARGYLSDPITEKGDPTVVKHRTGKWWTRTFDRPVSQHSLKRIAQFQEELKAKGADLVVSLSWVYAKTDETTVKNVKKTIEELSNIVPLIYNPKTLNLQTDSSLFADTHEHLLPEARIRRSRELVQQLRPIIQETTTQNHRIISILNR